MAGSHHIIHPERAPRALLGSLALRLAGGCRLAMFGSLCSPRLDRHEAKCDNSQSTARSPRLAVRLLIGSQLLRTHTRRLAVLDSRCSNRLAAPRHSQSVDWRSVGSQSVSQSVACWLDCGMNTAGSTQLAVLGSQSSLGSLSSARKFSHLGARSPVGSQWRVCGAWPVSVGRCSLRRMVAQ